MTSQRLCGKDACSLEGDAWRGASGCPGTAAASRVTLCRPRCTALPSLSLAPGSLPVFSGLGGLTLKLVGDGERSQFSCLLFSGSAFLGLLCPSVYVSLDLCLSLLCPTLPTKRFPREVLDRLRGSPAWESHWNQSIHPSTKVVSHFSAVATLPCVCPALPESESLSVSD